MIKNFLHLVFVFFTFINTLSNYSQTISEIENNLKPLDPEFIIKNLEEAQKISEKALNNALKTNNKNGEIIALYDLATIDYYKGNNNASINQFNKALKKAIKQGNKEYIKRIIYCLGTVNASIGNLKNAAEFYQKAIYLYKDTERQMSLIYAGLGKIHFDFKLVDEAIDYANKSLALAIQNKDSLVIGHSSNFLSVFYLEKMDSVKSKHYLSFSKPIIKKLNIPTLTYNFNESYSNYYVAKSNLDNALEFALLSYQCVAINKLSKNRARALLQIGKIYFLKEEYPLAEKFLTQAHKDAVKINELKTVLKTSSYLAKINFLQKKYKKSALYYQENNTIKDSLNNKLNLQLIANVKAKYNNEKRERELAENKLLIIQQKNYFERRNYFVTFLLIFAIITIIGGYFYYRQRQKLKNEEINLLKRNREFNKLQLISEGEERERKRIAQDLHDGVNGDLSVLKYRLSAIDKNSDDLNIQIKKTIELLDDSIDRLRDVSHSLHTPFISQLSIQELIEQYCNRISFAKKIKISLDILGDDFSLNINQKKSLYIVFQELIQNILKHSKATEIDVQISYHNKLLMMVVEDNGIGYDVNKNIDGQGLSNIKCRLSIIEATYDVTSNKNGTSSTIQLCLA